ncbi:hypothetical protein [Actinocatenispora rupis]|uniref:Uncharacterized protein n=1 Tax=Actinocatenispora rupis TaxID=519421 RepID=A0A8J3J1Z6_9ACTN|nr:hypothetical protein [Actinocatenispora rupis]GID10532.1 hypothetical protein Aru02nite_14210 [Actinocatenispora rupis]
MSDYLTSIIRTAMPVAVGALISWAALHGVNVPAGDRETVAAATTGVLILVDYAVVRAAERRWPSAGLLLGTARTPRYAEGRHRATTADT